MGYDIILGFREKPRDLESVLKNQGFSHLYTQDADEMFEFQMKVYRNKKGVSFKYHDGTYEDENNWKEYYGIENVVATGTLTASNWSEQDKKKQMQIGKFLRDYYNAVLEDSEEGKLITD